jgi:hypothetical protein
MTHILNFDASLFEDKYQRLRLSTRYAVDHQLYDTVDYDEFCKAFYELCPNVVTVDLKKSNVRVTNLVQHGEFTRKLANWCSDNCTGYWMNKNFPVSFNTRIQINLLHRYWAFQNVNDAIMFKLTNC